MFSNDIIGSSTADDGVRVPRTVRSFAEGVPTAETQSCRVPPALDVTYG